MCGRFSLTRPVEAIRKLFGFEQIPNLPARYNIAPSQAILAIRATGGPVGTGNFRQAFMARWGLIPSWAKDSGIGSRMINARAETAAEKPAFRGAFRKSRCLIPADGFFEWKTGPDGKQPYRIEMADGGMMAFAGLSEIWRAPDGERVESCTILTTQASPDLAAIHHRMPAILDTDCFDTWLTGDPAAAAKTLRPYAGDRGFTTFGISTRVNNVRNDDASILNPTDAISTEESRPSKPDNTVQLNLF